MSGDKPPFFNRYSDPGHILIWPTRDAEGKRTGAWECIGPHTGCLGGEGFSAEAVLEAVAANLRQSDEAEAVVLLRLRLDDPGLLRNLIAGIPAVDGEPVRLSVDGGWLVMSRL